MEERMDSTLKDGRLPVVDELCLSLACWQSFQPFLFTSPSDVHTNLSDTEETQNSESAEPLNTNRAAFGSEPEAEGKLD